MTFRWFGVINAILILLVLTKVALSFTDAARHSKKAESSNDHHECRDCARRKEKANEEHSHQKLISIRTEMIKNQILQKLRLSKPPEISNATPLMLKEFLHTDHPSLEEIRSVVTERKSDEFFGKIINVAVLPEIIQVPSNKSSYSSALMYFRLTPKTVLNNIVSAEIWFRNPRNDSYRMVVHEINNVPRSPYPKKLIALNVAVKPLSWHREKVGRTVKKWLSKQNELHGIEISCKHCDMIEGPVDLKNKPFLIIRTNSTSSRPPRSTCRESNSNACCVQELYINFTDIGWSDWIIQPTGYMANYCKGSCMNDIDIYRYHYTTIVREIIRKNSHMASDLNLGLCCTPSKLSSITIIYREDENNFLRKELPNMVVEECDCA